MTEMPEKGQKLTFSLKVAPVYLGKLEKLCNWKTGDHLIKLKALKHMQNLRANLKSNYLLGIILKLNYFLPSNSAYSAFPRSLKWTKTFQRRDLFYFSE